MWFRQGSLVKNWDKGFTIWVPQLIFKSGFRKPRLRSGAWIFVVHGSVNTPLHLHSADLSWISPGYLLISPDFTWMCTCGQLISPKSHLNLNWVFPNLTWICVHSCALAVTWSHSDFSPPDSCPVSCKCFTNQQKEIQMFKKSKQRFSSLQKSR